jgi:DNA-binding NtrC family response regulator
MEMPKEKIMIADDDENIVFAFKKTFENSGHKIVAVNNGNNVLSELSNENPAILFLDVSMPGMDGLTVLEKIKPMQMTMPVIVITGVGTMQTAIRAIQLGAYEYITKPLDVDKVLVVAERALETVGLRRELEDLKAKLNRPVQEYELIGNEPKMQEIYKTIGTITTTPNTTNVLIVGESGTGKELVARAIHNSGPFASEPFVAINCTVLPETLLESELFGHEKGAFTGADKQKLGKFEAARQGTIYLDEIGDMSPKIQQKLLRVLQERVFERLGGHEQIEVQARFIASTNKDLGKEIRLGAFREDLFFRLNVFRIELPRLQERQEDIPILCYHFLAKYNYQLNKNVRSISDEVMEVLKNYPFPGNVRELENTIEHAIALEKDEILGLSSLPQELKREHEEISLDVPLTSPVLHKARRDILEVFERKFIIARLRAHGGNVTDAAREAKIQRQSFQRLMKKYDINSRDFR